MAFTINTLDLDAAFDEIAALIALPASHWSAGTPLRAQTAPVAQPEPVINVDLFRRALEYVTDNPAEHDQSIWARRTETGVVGCLGYHAARLAGHTMAWERRSTGTGRCWLCNRDHSNESAYVLADNTKGPEGGSTHVFEAARAALGLSDHQANRLFRSSTTVAEQWRLAAEFTNGAIVRKANA